MGSILCLQQIKPCMAGTHIWYGTKTCTKYVSIPGNIDMVIKEH